MTEEWREIDGYYGYEVSNLGRVRSHWQKKHKPEGYGCDRVYSDDTRIMSTSDDGNGYLKLMLYNRDTGKRFCKKVHRLVAEAFVPGKDEEHDTVDHIQSGPKGKLDNSAGNLRWISRRDNIQKAYHDGVCDERIRRSKKMLIVHDETTNRELYFPSIAEAADFLHIDRTTVSHNIHDNGGLLIRGRYWVELIEGKERLIYDDEYYNQQLSWL